MTSYRFFRAARGAALISAVALAAALPAPRGAEAVPNYDGIWSVVIVTQQGICDTSYRYPIRISNGHVGNAGNNASVRITGRVGNNGSVIVNVSNGDRTATGTGRLAARSGGGSWSGGNGACSGTWQAERRS
jgi:hypothetical protein